MSLLTATDILQYHFEDKSANDRVITDLGYPAVSI